MIHGIGTDIVKIERIASIYDRHGDRLARHILMDEEQETFTSDRRPERFLAMRFAAKEAVVKALGTGFADGIWLRDVGVKKNELGRPEIIWSERGKQRCVQLGIGESHLTLSDDSGFVVAVAVLMRR
ncbi:MAG TPA: holo-ACP synthase [Steroidobacteraceae bacterium]|nr:holo-ACP synthase [Steroidobacteraceae bacterium]